MKNVNKILKGLDTKNINDIVKQVAVNKYRKLKQKNRQLQK